MKIQIPINLFKNKLKNLKLTSVIAKIKMKEHPLLRNVKINNLKLSSIIVMMMREKLQLLRNVKMKIWFKTVKNNNLKYLMMITTIHLLTKEKVKKNMMRKQYTIQMIIHHRNHEEKLLES